MATTGSEFCFTNELFVFLTDIKSKDGDRNRLNDISLGIPSRLLGGGEYFNFLLSVSQISFSQYWFIFDFGVNIGIIFSSIKLFFINVVYGELAGDLAGVGIISDVKVEVGVEVVVGFGFGFKAGIGEFLSGVVVFVMILRDFGPPFTFNFLFSTSTFSE